MKTRFLPLLLLVMTIGFPAVTGAQTLTSQRLWFVGMLQDKGGAASPFHWSAEFMLRSNDDVEAVETSSYRQTITFDVSSRSSVGGGYLIARSDPPSGIVTIEHRFFGQYGFRTSLGGGSLTFRTRLEDRLIVDDTGEVWRFRQQVRYTHAIKPGSKVYIAAYGEVFVHLNSTNRYARGIDHTRAYAGLGVTLAGGSRLEAGYLNHFIPGHNAPDRRSHILSSALSIAF